MNRLLPWIVLLTSCAPPPPWAMRFDGTREGLWNEVEHCTCTMNFYDIPMDNLPALAQTTRVQCQFAGEPGTIDMNGWPGEGERAFVGSFFDTMPGRFEDCSGAATATFFEAEASSRTPLDRRWVHFDAIRVCGDSGADRCLFGHPDVGGGHSRRDGLV
ncbi:MAG: hypothetical protein KC912_24835 [Proteobacteria bacterium]|nr:hypothetical protein [Pseudomonadota bacterium]